MTSTLAAFGRPFMAVLFAAALAACASRVAALPDMHDSRNALNWAGTYEGVLPCADCPGIRTRLVLRSDGRFELSTQYVDRQPASVVRSGRFQWNDAGNTITLPLPGERVRQFRVGEGRLLPLDAQDGVPPWDRAQNLLTKTVAND
ncbi:copper resistance protein NlpE [Accumulibacter sp.]|uniref:copper resistance protein NlpE n=1 Tax=Accumulibacter sp. TaxID=2053492 RepID=UPI0025D8A979|nr:copper resistance protein NlpE [Accumulibacter sp.]MCM8610858.1 copper resistance protein NlpE [Accumulibacter sp.]MCM8635310.1 copper resistance protein NlpE [Accumulibacter sp.]MCM8639026.1 copper resistance protein NlpE [Accumulibacter sp.]